ncbi:hypothetical protein DENSPDRAFT_308358 [Dentipellis sp. KUC8613]|nr:hypothetical protein DENSPDRAFT_308358 [Dentipellis sp. KUC8613]
MWCLGVFATTTRTSDMSAKESWLVCAFPTDAVTQGLSLVLSSRVGVTFFFAYVVLRSKILCRSTNLERNMVTQDCIYGHPIVYTAQAAGICSICRRFSRWTPPPHTFAWHATTTGCHIRPCLVVLPQSPNIRST